ncbi:MAG: endonuclease/exonuclease/phosphatase family protein [Lentisphaeria bacterium]|nr:endonuclease/exonuclease/phosphatase family protein [Lentisphaeria bacterium]
MDGKIIVGSFNVRVPTDPEPNDWASRKDRLCRDLKRLEYDIFGAQEAVPMQIADMEAAGYEHRGHGRNEELAGEGTPVFFRAARFEALEDKTIWLSETPDVFSIDYGSSLPRVATIVRFRDRETGRELVFANVHLAHRKIDAECRVKQLSVLLRELKKYQTAGLPVILTGDFNAHPDGPTYRLAAEQFRDSSKISQTPPVCREGRTFHGYKRVRPEDRIDSPIDFIFVSEGITVLSYESFDNFDENGLASSDHFPQKAVIRL